MKKETTSVGIVFSIMGTVGILCSIILIETGKIDLINYWLLFLLASILTGVGQILWKLNEL